MDLLGISGIKQNSMVNKTGIKRQSSLPVNQGLKADTVQFSTKTEAAKSPDVKMLEAVNKILDEDIKIKPEQPLVIRADKEYLPFIKVLTEEAYKRHSGNVSVEFNEPELDALKEKYYKGEDFKWKEDKKKYYEEKGAANLTFDKANSPFKFAKLSQAEIEEVQKPYKVDIPKDVQQKLSDAFNEEQIFKTLLNVQKGQPIQIEAQREHEPNVLKFVEYAYKNGSGPIDVQYTEPGSVLSRAKLLYADEKVLTTVPDYVKTAWEERVATKTTRLRVRGNDPEAMAGIDPKRIVAESKAVSKVVSPIRKNGPDIQWSIYYAPTTMSVAKTYSEYDNIMDALGKAAEDAIKINRCDHLQAHGARLSELAGKVNAMGLKEVHFYSVDPETKKPDGKTDLRIGLTDKARFMAAVEKSDDGIQYMPNTPTEEIFSSPDKNKVNGWVSTTLPLCLNGNMIEGIRMRFENGKAVEVYADKNQELWREHVNSVEGADMLGEVALVAGSPIFETGRVFNDTLLDENAACHIAIGNGFAECAEGAKEIKDYAKRQEYLKENNVNHSDIHTDFMIGGPNVIVEGIDANGKTITLIKDNAFQI